MQSMHTPYTHTLCATGACWGCGTRQMWQHLRAAREGRVKLLVEQELRAAAGRAAARWAVGCTAGGRALKRRAGACGLAVRAGGRRRRGKAARLSLGVAQQRCVPRVHGQAARAPAHLGHLSARSLGQSVRNVRPRATSKVARDALIRPAGVARRRVARGGESRDALARSSSPWPAPAIGGRRSAGKARVVRECCVARRAQQGRAAPSSMISA